jgi:hypothetical protein
MPRRPPTEEELLYSGGIPLPPPQADGRLAQNMSLPSAAPSASMMDAPPPNFSPAPPPEPPPAPPLQTGLPPAPPEPPRTDRSGALFDHLGRLGRKDLTATQNASEKSSNVVLEGRDIDPSLIADERAARLGLARQELRRIDEAERGAALASYLEPKRAAAIEELTEQTGAFRQQSDARRLEAMASIQKEIEDENKKDSFWGTRTDGQILSAVLGGALSVFASPDVASTYFEKMYADWRQKRQDKLAALEKKRGMTAEYWDLYRQQLDAFEARQLDRINRQAAAIASRGLPPQEAEEFARWFQQNKENPTAGLSPESVAAVRQETQAKARAIEAKKNMSEKDRAKLAQLRADAEQLAMIEAKTARAVGGAPAARDVTRDAIPLDGGAMSATSRVPPPGLLRTGVTQATAPAPATAPVLSRRPAWTEATLRALQEQDRRTRSVVGGPTITKDVR